MQTLTSLPTLCLYQLSREPQTKRSQENRDPTTPFLHLCFVEETRPDTISVKVPEEKSSDSVANVGLRPPLWYGVAYSASSSDSCFWDHQQTPVAVFLQKQ